jgi:hypothetical protein
VAAILGHCQASVALNVYAHATASGQAEAMKRLDALLVTQ